MPVHSAFLYFHYGGHIIIGHYFLDEMMMMQSDPLIENIMLYPVEAAHYSKIENLSELYQKIKTNGEK